nr:10666_t:CDS:2 [Entrophospora candida]
MPKYILDGEINIEPLISIRNILKRVLQEEDRSEILEMGAVQAFEVGQEALFPREVFRLSAQ